MEPVTPPDNAGHDGIKPAESGGRGQPKLRERKHGAAVPLDDRDKQLLNLLQSKFPLVPRPFDVIADAMDSGLDWVLTRTQELLDDRIIRELTPIFDSRALGYETMLVAASVDTEYPHRAARVISDHPGVSHNYLRNHEFNLWFTIATPPDSKLGLDGTIKVLARESGATSVRQLPTLRLFKINMNLEMEKGTETLAAPGGEGGERSIEPSELSELDYAVIRNLQGPMVATAEPYAAAAEATGIAIEELLDHLRDMQSRGLLRRVAALLSHRRAGFSANGMGVWNVPADRVAELGPQMAAYRGISHCYQRPTYEDWPYSVFTMAHGRSKEECDAILTQISDDTGITDRSTLYSSTEYKKVRLRYFTPDYKEWEERWT